MKGNRTILCLGTLIIALAGTSLAASIYTATGGITGNWEDTSSWASGALPGTSDTAYLRYGDTLNANSTIAVNQVRISNSSTLNLLNGADLSVNGGAGYTYVGYSLSTSGNYNMSVSAGAKLNTGRLYLGYNEGGTVTISGGSVTANERIFVGDRSGAAMATTQTGGTVTTAATDINFTDAGANGTYALNGGTFQTGELVYRHKNVGTSTPFTIGGTGTLKTSGIQYLDTWGATDVTFFQAAGIIDPALVDASGVTSEIADLVMYNNADTVSYTMDAGATLAMQISGTDGSLEGVGGYDQISVDDVLTADGTLLVSLIDGFVAANGDSFDLLDATTFEGAFATIDLPELSGGLSWDTDELLTAGRISVVPEPATVGLLACGFGLISLFRKYYRKY